MRSGVEKSSSASLFDKRWPAATFSPTVLRVGSVILSRLSALGEVMASAREAPDGQCGVVPAEAEAVAEYCVHIPLDTNVGSVVQIELGIRRLVVDGRWNDSTPDDHRADDGFDRACCAQHVTRCRFSGADVDFFCLFAEHRL